LLPESGDQLGAAADVAQLAASESAELGDVLGGEIGQAVLFEIAPDIFDGIEFRGVCRKRGGINAPLEAFGVCPHAPAPVDHSPIPDEQQFAGQLALEVLEKLDDLRTFDGSRVKLEIEIPDGDATDDRKFLPVEVKFEHRGFPARSPGAHPVGFLAQAAFINKDQDAVFLQGFFLSAARFPVSSAGWRVHRVGGRGWWGAGSSSQFVRAAAPHGRDGIGCRRGIG